MSLMKLLRTTDSLRVVRDQPHRYKIRTGALPIFGKLGTAEPEKKFETAALPREQSSGEVSGTAVESQTMKTDAYTIGLNLLTPK